MSEDTHDDPQTFQGAIERSKAWSKMRFEEADALALIAHCRNVLRSPGDHPKLIELWNYYVDVQTPEIRERFDRTDWSKTGGKALVLLSIGSIEIRKGTRNFLPSHFDSTLSDADKESL